jgi:hypothetical protein
MRTGNMTMKRILAIMLLLSPMIALADHLDVIEFKLNDGCSFDKYLAIVKDFNQWGAKNGYRAEILAPIQSNNLVSMYWVGRSKDAATCGKAWDTWRNGQSDPNSVESKLWVRFSACMTSLSRRGYDAY